MRNKLDGSLRRRVPRDVHEDWEIGELIGEVLGEEIDDKKGRST